MAFTYTTQAAGWALTVEQFGDPGTVSQLYTITSTSEIPLIDLTLYYEDGDVAYTTSVNPAGTSYSPTPVFLGEASRLVTRLLVTTSGPTTVLDCVWTEANTGENICGYNDCLAYYDPANIDGHGTTITEGQSVRYWRDLSGNENTMIATGAGTDPTWTALEIGEPSVWVDGAQSLQSKVFAHSQEWSVYATVKCATAGVIQRPVNADDGVGARQAQYLNYRAANTLRTVAFNTDVTDFAALTAGDAGPTSKHLLSAIRTTSNLQLNIDGDEVASTATTGTPEATTSYMDLATSTPGAGMWLGKVALFGVVLGPTFPILAPINLAPSPGGVLTATASPRGRVRIGMSISPDGGAP